MCVVSDYDFRDCVSFFKKCICFYKQKTAYEMRISDWSSDVCSSDRPGRYGVTPDTLTPMLNGNVFGQGYHRPFGSAVGNSDDIASHPGIRGGIDDRSATCRDHMRNRQTATDQDAAHVDSHCLVPHVQRNVGSGGIRSEARRGG